MDLIEIKKFEAGAGSFIAYLKMNTRNTAAFQWLSVVVISAVLLAGCSHRQSLPAADVETLTGNQTDIPALEQQVRKSPGDVNAWIALGNGLYDTSQWPKAIEAYQKALELDPKNVNVHVDLGTCYRYVAAPEKAMEEYRIAISIDPNHRYARWNAGMVLAYDLNRPEAAIPEFKKYLELSQDTPGAEAVRKAINELRSHLPRD